ncbi:MAG: FGGY-family carbohydrate kinase, partial [Alphaproteobacteria bacterium]
ASPPYTHVDAGRIWRWLRKALRRAGARHAVEAVVPTAHGSAAALVADDPGNGGLVLPIMDYEAEPPDHVKEGYREIAPPYEEVFAPTNPGGLTLGRQLYWQATAFPEAFARTRHILLHPQYWGWRLTGQAVTEVTSLGAQTHLWNPRVGDYASLVTSQGWRAMFPPMRKAWEILGPLAPEVATATGLSPGTPVLCGIHDSNANYLRYLAAGMTDFTLMSAGTWLIAFNHSQPLEELREAYDTVSNTDLNGHPVACSRFMAGREFEHLAGPDAEATATTADVERVIAAGTMALPSFTDSGGPVPGSGGRGRIVGPAPTSHGARLGLANLYTALMSQLSIELIGAAEDVIIDGGFASNELYCQLVAALRPGSRVMISGEGEGTARGAALLWRWRERREPARVGLSRIEAPRIAGLDAYVAAWRRHAEAGALPRGVPPCAS